MDGPVVIGQLVVRRRDIPKIEKLVMDTDPDTFITVEEITPLRSGYWGREGGALMVKKQALIFDFDGHYRHGECRG